MTSNEIKKNIENLVNEAKLGQQKMNATIDSAKAMLDKTIENKEDLEYLKSCFGKSLTELNKEDFQERIIKMTDASRTNNTK